MSSIEVVRIPVEAARVAELAAAVDAARFGYLAPPRCEAVRVLSSVEAGELIVIVKWSSREAHDTAAAEPESKEFLEAVSPLAAGPPHLGWFEEHA
jgi:quinol monooxygenase YgiN